MYTVLKGPLLHIIGFKDTHTHREPHCYCCHVQVIALLEMYSKWNDYFNNFRPKNPYFKNTSEF